MSKDNSKPVKCSFCGKTEDQVTRLVAGPAGVYICDKCIEICADIVFDEETAVEEQNLDLAELPKPVDIAKFPKNEGDYRLNVHNSKARMFYEMCDCKIEENSFEGIKNHKNKELMRTRHCLRRALLGCKSQEELFCEMVILAP